MATRPDINDKLLQVFFPHVVKKLKGLQKNKGRLVHYTTAETATKILRTQEIWLRNARVMNDFMEIYHGFECLSYAFKNGAKNIFEDILNSCHEGISDEILSCFEDWGSHYEQNTYLIRQRGLSSRDSSDLFDNSFSQHYLKEIEHGRFTDRSVAAGNSTTPPQADGV